MKPQLLPYANEKGILTSHAWPGGYPVFYLDTESNVICSDCANKKEITPDIVAADINYEDDSLYCDECCKRIESAYAEKELADNG